MIDYDIRFFDDYSGKTHILILSRSGNRVYVAKRVELIFEELPEGGYFKEPTFEIPWHSSKNFKVALKKALEGEKLPVSSVEGELTATKYHLEDMRKLALKNDSGNV